MPEMNPPPPVLVPPQPPEPPQPAIAPPIFRGEAPRPVSSWPTVVGAICIVIAAVGILMYGVGVLSGLIPGFMIQQDPAIAKVIADYRLATVLMNLGSLALAVTLLVGAIVLLLRKPWCTKVFRTYAILRLLYILPAGIVGYVMQRDMFQAMQSDPRFANSGAAGMMASMGPAMALVGIAFNALWWSALPIFLLWWFSRKRIVEDIAHFKA